MPQPPCGDHTGDARFRLLIEAVVDYAICMLDVDGSVASWNPGAQRFKGYAAHEIIGRHFSCFYTEEERAAGVPARTLETARREGRFECEGLRVRKDGTRFWAHVVIDPIRRPDGELLGYAKITRDITERKDAENALRESEERFRRLVQGVVDYAIYMLDPDGRVTSWNPGAQRFKGYAEAEILGEHFSRFYTEADRKVGLPARALATAAREGRFENEGWRVRKDGTTFWAHVVIDAIRDDTGRLLGFAKVTRDLTETRRAQEALDASENRFRLLVDSVTDHAIYMLDATGHVSSWNAGAQRIKAYSEAEILGRHFSCFYTDDERSAGMPEAVLATAAATGRFTTEAWRVRKDGSKFWASVVVEPIRDAAGAVIGFAKVTRDLTERRQGEEALAETRARLVQSQKMEALGQLTGGIAHDFNNLLAAVIGSLEILRKRLPDDPRLMRLLDNALQGAERGAALTTRMLAFARRQELKVEAVDVAELVAGMSDLLQRSIGPAIRIETNFPPGLIRAQGDPNELELALLNLVVNARDAMPDGGSIVISARAEPAERGHESKLKPGDYVCIAVADTGSGMDADTLLRATEPFFTTKAVGQGTGLGLSMVHGVAEQSGGRLVLRSRPGQGTTAEIWLPAATATAQTGVDDPDDAQALPQGRRLTVLVVDDDPLVLMNTATMLEDLGHEVIEASSSAQALRILGRATTIDLMVVDQVMAGMTGTELIDAVRSERPGFPAILATGLAELPADADRTLPRLPKPFQQATLARAIAQAIQHEQHHKVLRFPRQKRA